VILDRAEREEGHDRHRHGLGASCVVGWKTAVAFSLGAEGVCLNVLELE
jgi:hypothetical protein